MKNHKKHLLFLFHGRKANIRSNNMKKLIVVGAGFWGCTIAERIASVLKQPVLVVERRAHIGGNSWSTEDYETGIEVHQYGTHVFHTSDQAVWEYVSRFDSWNQYVHRVQAIWKGKKYQLPINLNTIESFYGMQLDPQTARKLIEQEASRSGIICPRNFEEKIISMIVVLSGMLVFGVMIQVVFQIRMAMLLALHTKKAFILG